LDETDMLSKIYIISISLYDQLMLLNVISLIVSVLLGNEYGMIPVSWK